MDLKKLKAELTRDENKKATPYLDNADPQNWTIGVGHMLGPARGDARITLLYEDEIQALLDKDIEIAENAVRDLLSVGNAWYVIEDARQRALVNMAFNLGKGRLKGFVKFLGAVRTAAMYTGESAQAYWNEAAKEMEDSKWYGQVGQRAKRLQTMIRTGQDA